MMFRAKTRKIITQRTIIPAVKYNGGSIMVRSCFSSAQTGVLIKIEGNMDNSKYQYILAQHFQASFRQLNMKKISPFSIITIQNTNPSQDEEDFGMAQSEPRPKS